MIEMDGTIPDPELHPTNQTWRRRVLAVGTVAALAMGAAGFAVGRATGSDSADSAAEAGAVTEQTDPTDPTPATAAPAPAAAADDSGSVSATTAATGIEGSESAGRDLATSGGAAGGGSGQYYPGAYEEAPQELLTERTTPDGTLLRAHIQRYEGDLSQPYGPGFGDWRPAGWCYPSGQLRISVSSPNVVSVAWAPWFTETKDGLSISTFSAGHVESAPIFGAVVQVTADVQSVTLATADGRTDTALVDDGVALLAVPGPIAADFTVTRTGDLVSSEPVASSELTESFGSREYRDACEPPPPALPAAGEQPADVAAADAAVREAWTTARPGGEGDREAALTRIDDATGIVEAWDALATGQYAEVARTATLTIAELVFTSPSEAWFRYDIETSISDFPNRYGRAVLGDDGVWRITRQTICQDLALGGAGCTPAVDPLLPPSAANDPRYSPMAGSPEGMPID